MISGKIKHTTRTCTLSHFQHSVIRITKTSQSALFANSWTKLKNSYCLKIYDTTRSRKSGVFEE